MRQLQRYWPVGLPFRLRRQSLFCWRKLLATAAARRRQAHLAACRTPSSAASYGVPARSARAVRSVAVSSLPCVPASHNHICCLHPAQLLHDSDKLRRTRSQAGARQMVPRQPCWAAHGVARCCEHRHAWRLGIGQACMSACWPLLLSRPALAAQWAVKRACLRGEPGQQDWPGQAKPG